MSMTTFIISYTILACIYLYLHRPARTHARPPRAKRVYRVTDLRLGCEHPTRDTLGRFLSKRDATTHVRNADLLMHYCLPLSSQAWIVDAGILRQVSAPMHMPGPVMFDDYSWSAEDVDLAYERYLDNHNNHPDALSDLEYAIALEALEARLDAQFQTWLDANPLDASSQLEDEDTAH